MANLLFILYHFVYCAIFVQAGGFGLITPETKFRAQDSA